MSTLSLQTKVQQRFCFETRADPCGLVVFGASGDLAHRKLFPALFSLRRTGYLPKNFYLIGMGRTAMTDEAFRANVRESLKPLIEKNPEGADAFLETFYYHTGDYDDAAAYKTLCPRLDEADKRHGTRGNRIFYLSIPPNLYAPVVQHLGTAGLALEGHGRGWSRLIVEKPFGHDADSAQKLTAEIQRFFTEEQTYRIDHYLGKETVQSILVLRFANLLFEPVWNRTYVDHVQITAAETLGVGHRAGYYEQAGVLRDMFQNHLLQLLCITAMEPPTSFAADRVRDEKSKVMQAIRPFSHADLDENAVRGQYGRGLADDRSVPGYREEKGVAPQSSTETFAALRLYIDNWRWQGVPFYIRSGKRMAKRLTEIAVQFKHVPHLLFHPLRPEDIGANILVMRIQPEEGISMTFETKHPGPKLCLSTVTMDFNYEQSFGTPPEAYERLFLDCMAGDQTLFNRSDWVQQSWGLLAPLLEKWHGAAPKEGFPDYPAGGWGPAASDALLARQGHAWRNL